ncbi:MAG: AAA family ATPase [Gammaproteobacteria bacterium]
MSKNGTATAGVYFLSLSLENVRCFGSRQTLNLSDSNARPAQWTVILGDNATGKTTLLQVLAGMEFSKGKMTEQNESRVRFVTLRSDFFRTDCDQFSVEANISKGTTLQANNNQIKDLLLSIKYERQGGGIFRSSKISLNPTEATQFFDAFKLYAYGATRRLSKSKGSLSFEPATDLAASLFQEQADLINAEEWLLQTDYIASKDSAIQTQAKKRLELIKEVLINLLPDVKDIQIFTPDEENPMPLVGFKTPDGWLRLDALSLGYKTMIAWMVDLAAHLFEHYPHSPNPIAEPAVVLIDEIDLHLHPKWQRSIMSYLSERFINTQFIVTAHSPLIVQAAENANIVVLKRTGNEVIIEQQDHAVQGWRIDQLLTSDLFDLKSARPPQYEHWLEQRRQILAKPKLTTGDKKKLSELEAKIGHLPTAETAEDIQAMDIIRRAARTL